MYDRDVKDVFVIGDKLHVEYSCPTEEGIFTKKDLEYFDILLTTCGTFNTNECIGCEQLCGLIEKKGEY